MNVSVSRGFGFLGVQCMILRSEDRRLLVARLAPCGSWKNYLLNLMKGAFSCRVVFLRYAVDPLNDVVDGETLALKRDIFLALLVVAHACTGTIIPTCIPACHVFLIHACALAGRVVTLETFPIVV